MKVLFTHDHKFYKDAEGRYYSDGQYPYRLWQRYLTVFDEIVVAARVRPLQPGQDTSKLNLSSGLGVSFREIPSVSSITGKLFAGKQVQAQLAEILAECDGLIARISEISLLAAKVADRMHKPWLAEVVYCPFDSLWNHGTWQGRLYAPYSYYFTQRMVAKAPFALYVTSQFLQRRYPGQGQIVSCSDVDLNCSNPEVLVQRLEFIKSKEHAPLRIGMIGALGNKIKGIHVALEALGLIKNDIMPFEFYALGGGDTRQWRELAMREGIADQTVFCGTLPHGEAVSRWLDAVDIYIQPSFQEGLPRALLEAMSRGCPAIGSSAGGIPELLSPECIHRPGNSKQLADLIKQAASDYNWRIEQAQKNYHTATQYDKAVLDKTRMDFWRLFMKACKESKTAKISR